MKKTSCEHCWHSFVTEVVRYGKNIHGPFCVSHPEAKRVHEHNFLLHKKKCCKCGIGKVLYEDYIDPGEPNEYAYTV
jgi:hypothetical protein